MIHAFISDGRLYVRNNQGRIEEIESTFVKEKQERAERHSSYHNWKNQADPADGYFNSSVVWGRQAAAGFVASYRFKDVIIADNDTFYYLLSNNVITGLFRYELSDGFETRLFHRNDLIDWGFDFSSARQEFVIAVQHEDMRCSLELFNKNGSPLTSLTAGDSRDLNPSFSRHNRNRILFQSAGISRDENGYPLLFGPEAIYCQDLEAQEVYEVLADDKYDFLLPKEDADGNLYFIRRPYQAPAHTSFGKAVLDSLLFPFRFVVAVVGFLNAFTKLFNQRSFRADGPDVSLPRQDKYVRILGRTIQMAKIQRSAKFKKEHSLVPGSWELVRRDSNGEFDVLSRNAASYDIDSDGCLYITNGYRVNVLTVSDNMTLFRHPVIEILKTAKS